MNPNSRTVAISFLIFPIFLYGQTETVGGTVVLIYGDTSEVIVAADSRLSYHDHSIRSDSACKIVVFGNNTVFVSSGIYEAKLGFNIHEIARTCYDSISDIEDMTATFFMRASSEVSKLMYTIRTIDSMAFRSILPFTAIEFAWVTSDAGNISVFWYYMSPPNFRGNSKTSGTVGEGDRWRSSYATILWHPLGIRGLNKTCMTANAVWQFLNSYGTVDGMRRLVETDAGIFPTEVGGAVDILRIDRSGVTWLAKKPYCQECERCPKE